MPKKQPKQKKIESSTEKPTENPTDSPAVDDKKRGRPPSIGHPIDKTNINFILFGDEF